MTVVSVSMPEELLDRIDQFADAHEYSGRSEVIRVASESLLDEFEDPDLAGEALLGVITVVFDYETTSVEDRMMELRHQHESLVTSNFHSHVGAHQCMELFVLEGSMDAIADFIEKVRATGETLSIEYSLTPISSTES